MYLSLNQSFALYFPTSCEEQLGEGAMLDPKFMFPEASQKGNPLKDTE